MRRFISDAGKNLKPYQGLKHVCDRVFHGSALIAGKNLKPYQGLKRKVAGDREEAVQPEKT